MAHTYSITFSVTNGNVGYRPHNPQLPVSEQIEDAYVPVGAKQNAMLTNTQVQVRLTDGRLRNVTMDAGRSDPSKNLIFLLPV